MKSTEQLDQNTQCKYTERENATEIQTLNCQSYFTIKRQCENIKTGLLGALMKGIK